MRIRLLLLLFSASLFCWGSADEKNVSNNPGIQVSIPHTIVSEIPVEIELVFPERFNVLIDTVIISVNGNPRMLILKHGRGSFTTSFNQSCDLQLAFEDFSYSHRVTPIPLWMSVLPPLIAILIALLFREVYFALFMGIWIGSVIITYYQGYGFIHSLFFGLFAIIDVYILEALHDTSHLSIIVFSMLIGAMVALISDNGGMKGVVNKLSRFAKGPRSGQLVTWFLGICIFFDDYANSLVVGNTMRPVTDKLKISREKLSYIVDSTAAPVTSIAFITTWIGAELSYIQDGIRSLELNETAYDVFLNSLQYSYYPILALVFVVIIILTRRDFGPMRNAEVHVKLKGIAEIHPGVKELVTDRKYVTERWFNAVIPVIVIVTGTITGLISTGLENYSWDQKEGFGRNISGIIGHSDSYRALLWASMAGVLTGVVLTITQRIMNLRETIESLIGGFKTMITAVLILVLAWSIANITQYMHTAEFISGVLLEINLTPYLVPALTFLLAAFVAFSTGSSWGTMAILYPLLLPATWFIAQQSGLNYDSSLSIFHNTVSAVLAGSVLGDHCSPISDTTILSSLASSCNHIEHVRTQMPYALVVGFVGIIAGTIPAAYGVPFYILFPGCVLILYLVVRVFGSRTDR